MHVFSGEIKIGDYNLYTGALGAITTAVNTIIGLSAGIYEGTLFIDNLISFMNEKQTVVPLTETPEVLHRNTSHTIEFQNVSFRYPGTTRDVIKNVNLTIRPGDTVVLVGLNGAGKTTLIKLLTRLYDPTEGRILLDGKDIREYDPKEVYAMFGIIFQDFGKYAFSVTENISFGEINKTPDLERIKEAATQSGADEYIEKLPDGYNTPLMRIFEENGIELSIGQWQKLAVSRAFYSDSDILILDEPTASLDPMAEQDIFNQFDRLRSDKTTIFVSHRLSSATVATKIVVLEYGEVIECGDHKSLMAKKGRYYELFSTQAKRYMDEEN
jgi:ABC-type multidrug transport system fused ATPase/permease subunit